MGHLNCAKNGPGKFGYVGEVTQNVGKVRLTYVPK